MYACFLGIYLGVEFVDHKASTYLVLVNTDRQVFQSGCNNYSLAKSAQVPCAPQLCFCSVLSVLPSFG